MDGRGTSLQQRSGVVLLSRDVVLASWLRYLCAPSVRVVSVASGYEAAAEILACPAEALVIDFRAMSAAHRRLLDTARALDMQILGMGKVPGDLAGDALSRVRLVSQADLPGVLREILSSAAAGAARAAEPPGGDSPGTPATGAPRTNNMGGSRGAGILPAPQDAGRMPAPQAETRPAHAGANPTPVAVAAERPGEPPRKRPRHGKLAPKRAPQGQPTQGPATAGPQAAMPPQDGPTAPVLPAEKPSHPDGWASESPAPAPAPTPAPAGATTAAPAAAPGPDKTPRQPSDLLTPEEVAALLESDL